MPRTHDFVEWEESRKKIADAAFDAVSFHFEGIVQTLTDFKINPTELFQDSVGNQALDIICKNIKGLVVKWPKKTMGREGVVVKRPQKIVDRREIENLKPPILKAATQALLGWQIYVDREGKGPDCEGLAYSQIIRRLLAFYKTKELTEGLSARAVWELGGAPIDGVYIPSVGKNPSSTQD